MYICSACHLNDLIYHKQQKLSRRKVLRFNRMLGKLFDSASIIISMVRRCLFRIPRPWPVIGEELRCQREEDNTRGPQIKLLL